MARSWPQTALKSCSRLKTSRAAHQELQQAELRGGQREQVAVAGCTWQTGAVEFHAAGFQHANARRCCVRNWSLMRAISSRTKKGFTM